MNTSGVDYIYGIKVNITNMITKDVQARKHRKKRINKKWLKRYGLKTVPDDTKSVMMNGEIFMTKKCYQKVYKELIRK